MERLNKNTTEAVEQGFTGTVADTSYYSLPTVLKEYKGGKLSYFIFDMDDNIFHLDTRIHMIKDGKLVKLTTAEFAEKRNDPSYAPPDGDWEKSMVEFRDDPSKTNFLNDLKDAIQKNRTAPSFQAFKKSLINANLFAIVTARGHSPQIIRKGIEYFIENVLTPEEKKKMVENIKKYIKLFGENVPDEEILNYYLGLNEYIGVSSPEFLKKFKGGKAQSPEHAKKVAITSFVERAVKYTEKLGDKYKSLSIGFSDDDPGNVKAVIGLMKNELSKKYPNVKFVVFDTSDPKLKKGRKIIISKTR